MTVEQKIIQASWPQPDSRVGAAKEDGRVRGRFSRKLPLALTAELVARCERPEPDRGPDPNFTPIAEQEREALIEGCGYRTRRHPRKKCGCRTSIPRAVDATGLRRQDD